LLLAPAFLAIHTSPTSFPTDALPILLVHAHLTFAAFEARFNAGARLDHTCQFRQRRLFHLPLGHARRTEVVMIAVAGILIGGIVDRKSTRLNSSHEWIAYAVFCLKKK